MKWSQPEILSYFLTDPYSRFEISAEITIDDPLIVWGINKLCQDCFIWQYKETSAQNWTDIDLANPQISMSITMYYNADLRLEVYTVSDG